MKWLSILLIITSFLFIGYSGYQLIHLNWKQDEALRKAQSIVFAADDNERKVDDIQVQDKINSIDFQPDLGEVIGILSIPKLNDEWAVIEGTRDEDLDAGVGHYYGTAFPSQGKQVFLAGHRDTVFTELGELVEGDIVEIQMSYGTFTYEIEETFVVGADDRTVIDYSIDGEVLTLCTCYPFRYVGPAPDRYIVNAKPVD